MGHSRMYYVVLQPPFPQERLIDWRRHRAWRCARPLGVVKRLFATTPYVGVTIVPTDSLGGLNIELVLGTWRRHLQ